MTPLLETRALNRRFGGLTAVDGVDFSLPAGEIRAVIGPNGAGKTTLAGTISGRIPPSGGQILFEGRDITRRKPWRRVTDGIVYTFQITSLFQNLSCHDNVALGVQRRLMSSFGGRLRIDPGRLRREVEAALERIGLAERIDDPASTLPYGHQRLLELAMGLALSPRLLIMDEPTQGLSETEIADFCALVRDIAGEVTLLLIEHNMPVVMGLAQRITVMDRGAILAEGTPEEVQANTDVQRAYLGG